MKETIVSGYVPVSLMDYPGKIASVVFLHGCNLRCRYCHNPELVIRRADANALDDFIFHLQDKDIEGVAVSGGEPLVSCGIEGFLREIKDRGFSVKLDTNGSLASKLANVLEKGLADFASVDVKAFNSKDLQEITRTGYSLDKFYETIKVLHEYDTPFELRHTLWKVPAKSEVSELMARTYTRKIVVQFPARYSHWLDRRFEINFSSDDVERIKEIFDEYEVTYRNLPE